VEKKADEGWTLLGAREDRRDLAWLTSQAGASRQPRGRRAGQAAPRQPDPRL